MKKSLAFTLAIWVALIGVYAYIAWPRLHEIAPTAMIAVLGGTFAAMLVASFVGLFTGARDRAALDRAINGTEPRDGHLEAVSGPIRPIGQPLVGPFTGRPCVAYEYDVKNADQGQSEFTGVALTPCAISMLVGSARVLGWSVLDPFPPAPADTIDRARGVLYLRGATFEPLHLTGIVSVLHELLTDADGTIHRDFRITTKAAHVGRRFIGASRAIVTPNDDVAPDAMQDGSTDDGIDLEGRTIEERIIPVDAVVTMLGRWSSAAQGFSSGGAASMNRVFPGDLQQIRKQLGGTSVRTFAIGLGFFLALHAILVPIYVLAPRHDRARSSASVLDERDCDRQKAALAAGADPNEQNSDGLTPLMNAAREGATPCVHNLLAAGARLETVDSRGDTAFAQAVMANRDDNAEVLRQAGASDFRVTAANGRPIAPGSPPLVAVETYLAAVQRGDFETMARLMPGVSVQRLQELRADLPFWQSIRPATPALSEGWMTDGAATLTVHGPSPKGERRVSYHVANSADGWRIMKEWFPE